MQTDWLLLLAMAVAVVGLVQFLKNLGNYFPNIPAWVWWLAMPAVALIVSISVFYLPGWVWNALMVLALAQLGYENIVKLVQKKIESM
jgi:divalent metal cation (Fe/Co/Zn/Cd) transporter